MNDDEVVNRRAGDVTLDTLQVVYYLPKCECRTGYGFLQIIASTSTIVLSRFPIIHFTYVSLRYVKASFTRIFFSLVRPLRQRIQTILKCLVSAMPVFYLSLQCAKMHNYLCPLDHRSCDQMFPFDTVVAGSSPLNLNGGTRQATRLVETRSGRNRKNKPTYPYRFLHLEGSVDAFINFVYAFLLLTYAFHICNPFSLYSRQILY